MIPILNKATWAGLQSFSQWSQCYHFGNIIQFLKIFIVCVAFIPKEPVWTQMHTGGGGRGCRGAPHVPSMKIFEKLPHKNAIKYDPPPGTVGKKQKFCAVTKKIIILPFWTILRTFQEISFLIRLHPRVLCFITQTLFLLREPQCSTKLAKTENTTIFCP